MHLYKEGDRSEAMCPHCKRRVSTRFAVRTVPLVDSGVQVPCVLAAVCDVCDQVVALPAQSAPKLKEALERKKDVALEARIPYHLEDVIHLLADRFSTAVAAFRPDLLRFYLREVASDAAFAERVRQLASSDMAQAPARARLSLRMPQALLAEARTVAHEAGIPTDAELLRGILLAAKEDVLEGGAPDRIARLSGAAQAEGAPRPALV
jgi:hypothetical protein